MKKAFKKLTALILCFALIVSFSAVSSFAWEKKTTCGDDCEFHPTVIIPGLGQSNTWVLDENGDYILDDEGNKVTSFPAYIEIPELIKEAAGPLILSLITQRDAGLSDALANVIELCFGINTCDENAQPSERVETERYLYSFAEYKESDYEEVNNHIPFNLYPTDLPDDHLYYFTYNSFDNHIDLVEELYAFLQMVKAETGHEKINIVPISQGGSIASALFEYHPEVMDWLHKVLFIVPALDGSTIIGDVFNDRVTFTNPEYFYNGFLGELGLLDAQTARMIEVIARILPDEVLMKCINKAVKTLVESVMTTSTSMWALCPSGDYPTAAEKYLSGPEKAAIRKQTDKYYQAQLNRHVNIQKLLDKGVQVFNVVEYDYAMINVGDTWNSQNADYIIQTDSTSMGAYFANVGETLPDDYVQKNTYCNNPEHNHISPDRVVDASAGLLPDTTFYFDGQRHDLTQHNDVILKIAMELIAHDDLKDVYSMPEFPQFNIGRDVRVLRTLLPIAEEVDTAALSAEDAAELSAAVAQAEAILDCTTNKAGEMQAAEERLNAILAKIGAVEAEEEKEPSSFFAEVSLWLNEKFGTNGFSEMMPIAFNSLLTSISDYIGTVITSIFRL